MGAVTVICTDKTGTLTQNKMTVAEIKLESAEAAGDAKDELHRFAAAIAVNTTADLDGDTPIGNPTEGALLMWLKGQGFDYLKLRRRYDAQDQIPFSTEKKYMATTVTIDDRQYTFVKGAPEILMGMCVLGATSCSMQHTRWATRPCHAHLAFAFCEGGFKDPTSRCSHCRISDPVRADVPDPYTPARSRHRGEGVTGDTSPLPSRSHGRLEYGTKGLKRVLSILHVGTSPAPTLRPLPTRRPTTACRTSA
jgi:Ca2+-transporting ATPase